MSCRIEDGFSFGSRNFPVVPVWPISSAVHCSAWRQKKVYFRSADWSSLSMIWRETIPFMSSSPVYNDALCFPQLCNMAYGKWKAMHFWNFFKNSPKGGCVNIASTNFFCRLYCSSLFVNNSVHIIGCSLENPSIWLWLAHQQITPTSTRSFYFKISLYVEEVKVDFNTNPLLSISINSSLKFTHTDYFYQLCWDLWFVDLDKVWCFLQTKQETFPSGPDLENEW